MAALVIPNARRPRQFRRIDRQTDDLNDDELRKRYRFGAANMDRLEELLEDGLGRQTLRNHPLTPRQQIMIALRFYASGGFLQLIGDTFGVDIATVSRTITRVTDLLFGLKDRYIKFPTTDADRQTVKRGFYAMRRFPGVIGCIDGTHVRIISPPKDDERAYVNRKRYHSINVQATCDHLNPEHARIGGAAVLARNYPLVNGFQLLAFHLNRQAGSGGAAVLAKHYPLVDGFQLLAFHLNRQARSGGAAVLAKNYQLVDGFQLLAFLLSAQARSGGAAVLTRHYQLVDGFQLLAFLLSAQARSGGAAVLAKNYPLVDGFQLLAFLLSAQARSGGAAVLTRHYQLVDGFQLLAFLLSAQARSGGAAVLAKHYPLVDGFQLLAFLLSHSQLELLSAACTTFYTATFPDCPTISTPWNIFHSDGAGRPLQPTSTG